MTPDFDEMVGGHGSPDELDTLRQVHDLLVSAKAPPHVAERSQRVPRVPMRATRSRVAGVLALAAALAVAAGLAIGYTIGHGGGSEAGYAKSMHGVGPAAAATAMIEVGKEDASGNRLLDMTVQALPGDHRFDLFLTKNGKRFVLCGTFETGVFGNAHVKMNAPGDLGEYDGWIVTAVAPGQRSRVLMTT